MNQLLSGSLLARWIVLLAVAVFGGAFIYGGAATMLHSPDLYSIMLKQFVAVVGLPSAALASLFLVMFLEQTSGPIEFEGLGFKFKGASGPVVLWVFCFLAIVASIKLLWLRA